MIKAINEWVHSLTANVYFISFLPSLWNAAHLLERNSTLSTRFHSLSLSGCIHLGFVKYLCSKRTERNRLQPPISMGQLKLATPVYPQDTLYLQPADCSLQPEARQAHTKCVGKVRLIVIIVKRRLRADSICIWHKQVTQSAKEEEEEQEEQQRESSAWCVRLCRLCVIKTRHESWLCTKKCN